MTLRPPIRLALLAAALASAASAWAAYEYQSTYVPAPPKPRVEASAAAAAPAPAPVDIAPSAVAVEQALAPHEEIVTTRETTVVRRTEPRPVIASDSARAQPGITITEPRLTDDQRIQAEVIDLLARNPSLSGRIGVVSEDRVVTLTGYTTTSGQAWRAGRDARGVYGVRHVVNEIRPRVGGITS